MPTLDIEIAGKGRNLVLLHSLLTDRTSFRQLVERTANERRLILVNMPGFGASPPAAPLDGYADRIIDLMDELALPRDTDILGNGLGGFVALNMAIRHPGRINRMVLLGSAIAFPEAGRATFRFMAEKADAAGMAPLADAAMQRMFPPEYSEAHPEVIADRRAVFTAIDPGVFAAACRALASMDLAADVARIGNDTLVVVGSHDGATTPPLGLELAARLPHGQIIELAGIGHAPHIQAPDALIAAIGPFLGLGQHA